MTQTRCGPSYEDMDRFTKKFRSLLGEGLICARCHCWFMHRAYSPSPAQSGFFVAM